MISRMVIKMVSSLKQHEIKIAVQGRALRIKESLEQLFILIQPLRDTDFGLWNRLRNLIEGEFLNVEDIKNIVEVLG